MGPTQNGINQLGSPLTPVPDEEMGQRGDDEEEEMNGIHHDSIPMEYGDEDEDGQAARNLDWADYNLRDEEDAGVHAQRAGADSEGDHSIIHLLTLLLMSLFTDEGGGAPQFDDDDNRGLYESPLRPQPRVRSGREMALRQEPTFRTSADRQRARSPNAAQVTLSLSHK